LTPGRTVNVAGCAATVVEVSGAAVVGAGSVAAEDGWVVDDDGVAALSLEHAATNNAATRHTRTITRLLLTLLLPMADESGSSNSARAGRSPIGQNEPVADDLHALDSMLEDLATLVNVESPSRDLDALGKSAAALSDVIEARLGTRPAIIDTAAGPIVHWTNDSGDTPRALIVGHHDTVHPLGSLAARPFTVSDGTATGPGVFDMKAGIVQAIHAVAALDDRSGVELLFTPDEETGSLASREYIEERALACGAVLVLEPSADGGALKTARKGVGTFEVTIHGRAAHAGLEPEKGVNALVEAAHQVLAITTFADPAIGTTVTPTVATAGTTDNVVPAQARILVDVRVEAAGEKERVEAAMAGLRARVPDARIEIGGGINRPPMPASASESLFATAVAVGEQLGMAPVTGVAVGGGSDGNFTAARGVPTLDGLGAVGGGAHADHEFVLVESMPERAKLLTGLLSALRQR